MKQLSEWLRDKELNVSGLCRLWLVLSRSVGTDNKSPLRADWKSHLVDGASSTDWTEFLKISTWDYNCDLWKSPVLLQPWMCYFISETSARWSEVGEKSTTVTFDSWTQYGLQLKAFLSRGWLKVDFIHRISRYVITICTPAFTPFYLHVSSVCACLPIFDCKWSKDKPVKTYVFMNRLLFKTSLAVWIVSRHIFIAVLLH